MEMIIGLLGRPSESDLQAMEISQDNKVIDALSRKKNISFSKLF